MNDIAGIPYTTAEFDEKGQRIREPELPADAREIIIVSHGWNNNRAEAEGLYLELFRNFASMHPGGTAGFAIIGVIWPSKKFDFSDDDAAQAGQGAIGAASTGGASTAAQQKAMERAFDEFEAAFEGSSKQSQIAPLRALLPRIEQPDAQTEFVRLLRNMVEMPAANSDFDGAKFFFGVNDPRDVFVNARQASSDVADPAVNGSPNAISGVGLRDVFSGVANAVSSLLNITTYYEMKMRAGTVGEMGLAPLIDQLANREQVRHVHLIGHSFGARLVTAAAMKSTTPKLHSLSLLQAAFSHNGFSTPGYFRKVVERKRLTGPIVITHTENDKAVGKAYAIASRVSKDSTSGMGDAGDKYGGLGRNGAVNMAANEVSVETRTMLKEGEAYTLKNQTIHNLESSPYISGHGDVAGREVAWAISRAIATAAS